MKRFVALAFLAMSVAATGTAYAQFETATVLGTVRDASNAIVPDVTVTLDKHRDRRLGDEEDEREGDYEFFTVRAGIYMVKAELTGFAMALVENVQVEVGARQRVDAQMSVGQVTRASAGDRPRRRSSRPTTSAARTGDHRRSERALCR